MTPSMTSGIVRYDDERITALRVLVADPYAQLREIIRDILLRGIGVAEVYEARDNEDIITLLHDLPCDVVIADTNLSPVGAVELTEKIRAGEDGVDPFTPVIVMSGHADLKEIITARDAGANDYIAKPLSAKILDLRLHALVERPRPFIRSDDFFGPDRRRHHKTSFRGSERRSRDEGLVDPSEGA